MPSCGKINDAVHEVCSLVAADSNTDEHIETTNPRKGKDNDHTMTLLNFFLTHNPFEPSESLRNVSSGVNADATVNVDNAKLIGQKIIDSMQGTQAKDYTFVR